MRPLLFPKGFYVLVKRFSSKEEKRRIVASLVNPDDFEQPYLAFENHVNVLHAHRKGLTEQLALGLIAYLNSDMFDRQFRIFSGHTQVNASDLRRMKFPARETLEDIGESIKSKPFSHRLFDEAVKERIIHES